MEFKGFIVAFYLLAALPLNAAKLLSLRYASNCLEGSSQEQSVAVGGGRGTLLNDCPPSPPTTTPPPALWRFGFWQARCSNTASVSGCSGPAWPPLSTGSAASVEPVRGRDEIRRGGGGAPALERFF